MSSSPGKNWYYFFLYRSYRWFSYFHFSWFYQCMMTTLEVWETFTIIYPFDVCLLCVICCLIKNLVMKKSNRIKNMRRKKKCSNTQYHISPLGNIIYNRCIQIIWMFILNVGVGNTLKECILLCCSWYLLLGFGRHIILWNKFSISWRSGRLLQDFSFSNCESVSCLRLRFV